MPDSRRRTLIAALSMAIITAGTSVSAVTLDYIGTYVWNDDDPRFGGFSGIEITENGKRFHVISDRTNLFWGNIDRDGAGRIRHLGISGRAHLKGSDGAPLSGGYLGDSEGLAIDDKGRIWVSFEGLNRVVLHTNPDAPGQPLPRPPAMPEGSSNAGLESLAIDANGALFTIPERSSGPDRPFPVLRFKDGEWDQPFTIRREGRWLPVGSDFGPDGWFYLLERSFQGVLGFSSRVSRFRFDDTGVTEEQRLLETSALQYDNLEGLSVWHDGQGIRLTMISDDNFLFVQRTELVEYRLRE